MRRRAKGKEPRAVEADVLKPVPRIDANYLRSISGAVGACVVECQRPKMLEELVKAARTGAYDVALNVSALCGAFETEVDPRWAAMGLCECAAELGIATQISRGETRRLGMDVPFVMLELSWKEGARR